MPSATGTRGSPTTACARSPTSSPSSTSPACGRARAAATPTTIPSALALRAGGEQVHEAQLWHADRFADDRLDRLLRRWQALTEEVTDGALPYGEPR